MKKKMKRKKYPLFFPYQIHESSDGSVIKILWLINKMTLVNFNDLGQVYAGIDTKLYLNMNQRSYQKVSSLEKFLNQCVLAVFAFQFFCIISAVLFLQVESIFISNYDAIQFSIF